MTLNVSSIKNQQMLHTSSSIALNMFDAKCVEYNDLMNLHCGTRGLDYIPPSLRDEVQNFNKLHIGVMCGELLYKENESKLISNKMKLSIFKLKMSRNRARVGQGIVSKSQTLEQHHQDLLNQSEKW